MANKSVDLGRRQTSAERTGELFTNWLSLLTTYVRKEVLEQPLSEDALKSVSDNELAARLRMKFKK